MIYDDISAALVTAGLGQITSTNNPWFIFVGYLQDAPDQAICIYPAGGRAPETTEPADYPTIQIRVRGVPADEAGGGADVLAKELAIFKFLHAGDAVAQFGDDYVYCFAIQSGPMPLGQDEKRRLSYVRNYRIMVDRSGTSG